jgi:hypothetical protein
MTQESMALSALSPSCANLWSRMASGEQLIRHGSLWIAFSSQKMTSQRPIWFGDITTPLRVFLYSQYCSKVLLRQLVEQNGFWRTTDKTWVTLDRIQFVGACNPPTTSQRPIWFGDITTPLRVFLYSQYCSKVLIKRSGAQRAISFLRQLVEQNGFWRTTDKTWVTLDRIQFVGQASGRSGSETLPRH